MKDQNTNDQQTNKITDKKHKHQVPTYVYFVGCYQFYFKLIL